MWTKAFWTDAAERALKTFAQAFACVFVSDNTGLVHCDFAAGLSVAGMAMLLSLVTSIGSSLIGPRDSASLVTRSDR